MSATQGVFIEDPKVILARDMMRMLREFVETTPEAHPTENGVADFYQNLAPDYVLELAKGAALLIEATSREEAWCSAWNSARSELEDLRASNAKNLARLAVLGVKL